MYKIIVAFIVFCLLSGCEKETESIIKSQNISSAIIKDELLGIFTLNENSNSRVFVIENIFNDGNKTIDIIVVPDSLFDFDMELSLDE